MIRKKNKLYKKWIESNLWETWNEYIYHKKKVASLVAQAKQNYYQSAFSHSSKNIKKLWENINDVLGRRKLSNNINMIKHNNEEVSTPENISEVLNSHFTEVAIKLNDMLPQLPYKKLSQSVSNSMVIESVDEAEIECLVKGMKNKKSVGGMDYFSVFHLKLVIEIVARPLSSLISLCIKEGIFPNVLKIARVVPLFKSGIQYDPNNYRPISLLSVFSKVFEKVLKNRIESFIGSYNLLSSHQYGFRKNSSTTLALLDFTSTIEMNRNLGKHSIAIFLDLKKAFDTVNHKILLDKLNDYGFRGKVLDLFTSYLTNRKQFTLVQEKSSTLKPLICGVPQGSVLGPLLFLLYINDFSTCCEVEFRFFADDTAIIISHYSLELLHELANKILQNIHEWLIRNKLTINLDKTYYMFFHVNKSRAGCLLPPLSLNHTLVNFTTCTKYLGFMIDEKLSWKTHIDQMYTKLRKWVGIFWKVGCLLNQQTKYIIYSSLFHSILLYGIEVYGNAKQTHLKKIQTLQNRALKALFHLDRRYPSQKLYQDLGVLNLESSFHINSSLILWKLVKLPVELHVYEFYKNKNKIVTHKYATREKGNYNLMFHRSAYTTSNTFKLLLLWNQLPSKLKEIDSFTDYKHNIHKHFAVSIK